MLSSFKAKKSFTLIEMLIVIVIIGILAAALVPRLQSVQARARDTDRKIDLRNIYQANEVYLLDNGVYPPLSGATVYNYFSTGGLAWTPSLTGYLYPIPVDPINNGIYSTTGSYTYRYGNHFSGTANSYDLTAKLENTRDPQNCQNANRTYGYPTTGCIRAGTSYNITHFILYLYEYSPHSGRF